MMTQPETTQAKCEELEPREMLSGDEVIAFESMVVGLPPGTGDPTEAMVATADPSMALQRQTAPTGTGAPQMQASPATTQAQSQPTFYEGNLWDKTGTMHGRAAYQTTPSSSMFTVSISGAAASTTYAVVIDGVTVGQLTTNASGGGTLTMSSDAGAHETPLPANFPQIHDGSTVTVGPLHGMLSSMRTG
jgi:hypothetical protein